MIFLLLATFAGKLPVPFQGARSPLQEALRPVFTGSLKSDIGQVNAGIGLNNLEQHTAAGFRRISWRMVNVRIIRFVKLTKKMGIRWFGSRFFWLGLASPAVF